MRKAFDTNVPKLKPRLRPAMVVVSDTTPETQEESTISPAEKTISEISTTSSDDISDHDSANVSEPESSENEFSTNANIGNTQSDVNLAIQNPANIPLSVDHDTIAKNIVPFPHTTLRKDDITENDQNSRDNCILKTQETAHIDTAEKPVQLTESTKSVSVDTQPGMHNTVSAISSTAQIVSIDDSGTRRKRLEDVKRKVVEAVRPEVTIEPVPEDPALAVESVLALVNDLEAQLSRSRDLEKALRSELAEAKAELTRTVNDGRSASGRLAQAEAQLDEKRKILEEMLFEMSALEEERDQAVRMVQMLTVKDSERRLELDDLGQRYTEMQRALDQGKLEEERLTSELDEYISENARLHTLLTEITKERDNLAHNVEQLTKERDELTEAKKALEKVHHALSQARARLRE